MTLIAILLALLLERAFSHYAWLGRPVLLHGLVVRTQRAAPSSGYWRHAAAPVLLLILCVLLAAAVDQALAHPLLRLPYITLVLLLCLGPRDLADDVQALIQAREAGNEAEEQRLMRVLLHGPARRHSRRGLIGALFVQSHERLFGVLLWFFLLGPAGAVLYRVASRMPRFLHETQPDSAAEHMAMKLHGLAAWLPARLTTLLFGLAGSLDGALSRWRHLRTAAMPWREGTWAVLAESSTAALAVEDDATDSGPSIPATLPEALREVLALQNRALLILLAAFAAFTAGGYIA